MPSTRAIIRCCRVRRTRLIAGRQSTLDDQKVCCPSTVDQYQNLLSSQFKILAAFDKRDTIRGRHDPLTNPCPIGTTRLSQQRRPDCHHKQSYQPVAVYFNRPSWSSRRADSKSIVLSRKFQEQQQLCNKTFPPPSDAPTKVVVAAAADLSG